jgi:hypothetical protein
MPVVDIAQRLSLFSEHCPVTDGDVSMMLIEPSGVVNTGDAGGELTSTFDDGLLG